MQLKPEFHPNKSQWFAVRSKDGRMHCSCSRPLVQVDKNTWRCSFGYPQYRFEDGTVIKDKFGNLLFKEQSHEEEEGKTDGK